MTTSELKISKSTQNDSASYIFTPTESGQYDIHCDGTIRGYTIYDENLSYVFSRDGHFNLTAGQSYYLTVYPKQDTALEGTLYIVKEGSDEETAMNQKIVDSFKTTVEAETFTV